MGLNCAGIPPKWDAKFYVGDHAKGAIVRCIEESSDGKTCTAWHEIHANEEIFSQYVCVIKEDIQKLFDEVLTKCEKWQGFSAQ